MKVGGISRFKKERFLRALSEDDFRDKVVRPLFFRLGYADGRDLCGPREHGKDSLFVESDRLGLKSIVAVQTKKGNLNLASKASSNLVSAVAQLRTALCTSVVLLADKSKCLPNKAILCASGKINDAAQDYVFDQIKNPNIQFLDVDELIPRIDSSLPELWLGIDAEVVPYFRAIEALVIGENNDASSGADGVLQGAAADVSFVELNLFRSIRKSKKVRGKVIDVPGFEEFPLASIVNKKNRLVLITGEAGAGKSTGLLRIALEIARQGLESEAQYKIPVLLRASELLTKLDIDFIDFCDQKTRQLTRSQKSSFTADDLAKGNVVLLVDGLDEISDDMSRREVLRLLLNFSSKFSKCQVIVTSRPAKVLESGHELLAFADFRVSPINWRQAEKIVKTVAAHKTISNQQSQEFLRRLEKIHGIELNPLLVTVFAATTDYTKQDIPANITELFKKFTELMLGRWDERKGMKHQFQAPLKDFVLTQIAFGLHSARKTSINRGDADRIARQILETRGHDANVEQLLTEIFDRSGLFRIVGSELEFRHHLLQEFFAGRGIPHPDFVSTVIHDDWWKRALVFYFGEHPDRIDLIESAMNAVNGSSAEKLFDAAVTIGLAVQACYLSPVTKKIGAWKWVVEALGVSQDLVQESVDPKGKYPLAQFFSLYLYARESVALSHVHQYFDELTEWATTAQKLGIDDANEKRAFWLIAGLIESGELVAANKVLQKQKIKTGKLLAAISLGSFLALEVRPLQPAQKRVAKQICDQLADKVEPFRKQLVKEYGSILLEYRSGEIEAVEGD